MPCALPIRSEEHTSELQSHDNLVCRLLLEQKRKATRPPSILPTCQCGSVTSHASKTRTASRQTIALRPSTSCTICSLLTFCFCFNDAGAPDIPPLPLHDALPI